MSGNKEWPELVGKTFEEASTAIRQYDNNLNPYNAPNGIENRMYDPYRVVCVTDGNDIVTKAPSYKRRD
ncbi:hypothetical protein I4U23_001488 [Adineta vaga]|nr:hypothetical protein I4U23_001488 [Adineta vaga]